MKSSLISILHTAYWLAYLGLWLVAMAAISQSPDITNEEVRYYAGVIVGIAIVPAIFSFYTFYFLLFPRYLQSRKIPQSIVSALIVSLSSFFVAALTLRFTADMGWSCYGQSNYVAILIVSFISLINGLIAFVIRGFITWFQEIKVKEELQKKNHEMELALVKSQLDPHFLFNTLNNIDMLIIKDPDKASAYLNQLSDIMRFMLFETRTEEITLQKELEYIRKYVELQKIRTANYHYVNFKVNGETNGRKIAPLVFVPIIENAFKHTNNKKLQNAIDIQVNVNGKSVELICVNKIDSTRPSQANSNGLGHQLIEKRLNLIYGERQNLMVKKDESTYSVALKIYDHEV